MDQADTRASNKADIAASEKVDIGNSNGVGVTIESDSENDIITRVKNKVKTAVFYRLDWPIPIDNHAGNLLLYILADILANLFGDLSSTIIDLCFSFTFFVFSSYLTLSDGISDPNFLILYLLVTLPLIVLAISLLLITDYLHI